MDSVVLILGGDFMPFVIFVIVVVVIVTIVKNIKPSTSNRDYIDPDYPVGRKHKPGVTSHNRMERCTHFANDLCPGQGCMKCSLFKPMDINCANRSTSCDYRENYYCNRCKDYKSKSNA